LIQAEVVVELETDGKLMDLLRIRLNFVNWESERVDQRVEELSGNLKNSLGFCYDF
jgi:hypothetical protein